MLMKTMDFKKAFRDRFTGSDKTPTLISIPKTQYLSVSGKGDPALSRDYAAAIEVLFSVSYATKFLIKRGPHLTDYSVLPLESMWWVENTPRLSWDDKSNWLWKVMIMQPDLVEKDIVETAVSQVEKKKKNILSLLSQVKFEEISEGMCAQILHKGPYANEGPTIEKLHSFIDDNGFDFNGNHHEVYLSDPRQAVPEKLRKLIRQPVKGKSKT
ncbi:MAG: hypothetical protein ACI9BD_000234 [Candidatus Marinamargulisbacteria bacterium]|jgi:hypothetical protein